MPSDRETAAEADARLSRLAKEWFADARRKTSIADAAVEARLDRASSTTDTTDTGDWSWSGCGGGDDDGCD